MSHRKKVILIVGLIFFITILAVISFLTATRINATNLDTGTGALGALSVTSGTTYLNTDSYPSGFNYTTITIASGATLSVTGSNPLILKATGAVTINGTIDISGGAGAASSASSSGGTGGTGIAGGSNGGAHNTNGSGSGYGYGACIYSSTGSADVAGGGGGAGFGTAGSAGHETYSGTACTGAAGTTYGTSDLSTLVGGSGGGGGGSDNDSGTYEYGAGGGAGGGAVKIIAQTITVSSTGAIKANGGAGGAHNDINNGGEAGAGGGGSGGAIRLETYHLNNAGSISVAGGAGGVENATDGYGTTGGAGGYGRIAILYTYLDSGSLPSGSYVYTSVLTNNAPPVSTPTYPTNGSVVQGNGSSITFTTTAVTDVEGSTMQYYFRVASGSDAETGAVCNSGWQTSTSYSCNPGAGTFYWHVYTYDGTTQTNPSNVYSFYNNYTPSVSALVSPANNAWVNSRQFCVTVTDPNSENVTAHFVITGTTYNGTTVASGNNSCYTHTADLNGSTWYAYATDTHSGVSSNTSSYTAKIDTVAPAATVGIINPYYNASSYMHAGTITGTANDASYSGLSSAQITIQRSSDSLYWTGSTWGSSIWLALSTSNNYANWTYTIDDSNFTSGVTYTVTGRATDIAGNTTSSGLSSDSFVYDITSPAAPSGVSGAVASGYAFYNDYSNGSFTLSNTGDGSDSGGSGLSATPYKICYSADNSSICSTWLSGTFGTSTVISGSDLPATSGSYKYYYWYTIDQVGNLSGAPVSGVKITLDTTAPGLSPGTVTHIYDAGLSYTATVPAATDSGSGIGQYRFCVSTSNSSANCDETATDWQAGTAYNFTGLTSGQEYWYFAQAKDNLGYTTPSWAYFANTTQDDDLPTAVSGGQYKQDGTTVLPVGESTLVGEEVVNLKAGVSDTMDNTLTIQFEVKPVGESFDGSTGIYAVTNLNYSGTTLSATKSLNDLTDGISYHWRYRALDQAGNAGPWISFGNNAESERDFAYGAFATITSATPGIHFVQVNTGKDLSSEGITANSNVDVQIKAGSYPVSDVTVDLSSSRVWNTIFADTSKEAGKSVIAYLNNSDSPGAATTHILYVPIPANIESNQVRVCLEAKSLAEVTTDCASGYTFSENETRNISGATITATKATIEDQSYWKIDGVMGTGGIALATTFNLYDSMTRLQAGTASDHEIYFGTISGITSATDNIILEFPDFDLSTLSLSDIKLYDDSTELALAASAGDSVWGVVINAAVNKITFFAPQSGNYVAANSQLKVTIGSISGGTNQIVNPDATGQYEETITIGNTAGVETGEVTVAIVDSDAIKVDGFVGSEVYFNIDASVADSTCTYNTCLTHENGAVAPNYTIDLGELNLSWVNKSNGSSVKHADDLNGVINSIYFSLSTNATGGVSVNVMSANGALTGEESNIQSVTDGSDIEAGDGLYGFQVLHAVADDGSLNPNTNCMANNAYCGFTKNGKEVFDSNGGPVDNARVRMDVAAAAGAGNSVGSYSDSLRFIVTAAY